MKPDAVGDPLAATMARHDQAEQTGAHPRSALSRSDAEGAAQSEDRFARTDGDRGRSTEGVTVILRPARLRRRELTKRDSPCNPRGRSGGDHGPGRARRTMTPAMLQLVTVRWDSAATGAPVLNLLPTA
jgi:hypothetical protein